MNTARSPAGAQSNLADTREDVYLAQKDTQQKRNAPISCNLVKTVRLIGIILVCTAPTRILCFDLDNGQMTFNGRNFQGHGPADHDPNMRVI